MPFVVSTFAEEVKFSDLQSLRLEGDAESHILCLILAHQAQDLSPDVERNAIRTGAEDTTDSFALPDSCTLKSLSSNQIPQL